MNDNDQERIKDFLENTFYKYYYFYPKPPPLEAFLPLLSLKWKLYMLQLRRCVIAIIAI